MAALLCERIPNACSPYHPLPCHIYSVEQGIDSWNSQALPSIKSCSRKQITKSGMAHERLSLDDIDTRWSWRAGWPRLCQPRVETVCEPKAFNTFNISDPDCIALGSRIDDILASHQISHRSAGGVRRALFRYRTHGWRHKKAPSDKHFRLLVDYVYDPEQLKTEPMLLARAVIDLHAAMCEIIPNASNIGVELYDASFERTLCFADFPPSSNDLKLNWNSGSDYRSNVLAILNRHPTLWQAMLPIGLEASNEKGKTHICILWIEAHDTEDSAWPGLEREISSVLPSFVSVQIWQAALPLLCNSSEQQQDFQAAVPPLKDIEVEDFGRPPKAGTSVGLLGERSIGGTLGGYVRVRHSETGEERTYGVTNAHVAVGPNTLLFGQLLSNGRASYTEKDLVVQCPFEEDRNCFLTRMNYSINELALRLERLLNRATPLQQDDNIMFDPSGRVVQVHSTLECLRDHRNKAGKNPEIGYVTAAAFGVKKHTNPKSQNSPAMDLALIDMGNLVPHPNQIAVKRGDFAPENEIWESWAVDSLVSESESESIRAVAKHGRTSGETRGIVHDIKVDINLPLADDSFHTVSAWAARRESIEHVFVLPGDSGSFLFTRATWHRNRPESRNNDFDELFVVGLLFGSGNNGELGYFIPFDAVKQEIEALTGGEMIWPRQRAV